MKDLSIFNPDKNTAKRESILSSRNNPQSSNHSNINNTNNNSSINNGALIKTLQKLLKVNDETNTKLLNEIKNYHVPEKEQEIQNQRYYEIQAFIEANKQKIEQVEKYDELLKENLKLKEENEKLRKTHDYIKDNKTIRDIIVITQ